MMKQANYTHKQAYLLSRYDLNAAESWLEEKSRKGWRAQQLLESGVVVFARTEAAQTPPRYRLQPFFAPVRELSDEEYELYGALGWSYLGGVKGLRLWRCDDPEAPELETDPVMQAEGCRRLLGKMFLRQILPSALLLSLLLLVLTWGDFPLLNLLYSTSPAYLSILTVLLPLITLDLLLELRHLMQLARRLKNGIPQHRSPAAWKTKRALVCLGGILWACLLLLPASSPHVVRPPLDETQIDALVELSALEGRDTAGHELTHVETKRHELASRIWLVAQDSGESHLSSAYFHMRFRPLANRATEELSGALPQRYGGQSPLLPQQQEWLYSFCYGTAETDGGTVQLAVVQLGRNVLSLAYHGPEDLREHLPEIREALAQQP